MATLPAVDRPGLFESLRERWYDWRNRKIANAAFQRFAATFPLTRPFVAKSSRDLFDICAGFVYTQILLACVRADLFAILEPGPLGLDKLAELLKMDRPAAKTLLEGAAALGLLERRSGGCYGLGQLGAAMIGNPGIASMVEHHALLYRDLEDPLGALRNGPGSGELGSYWAYAGRNDQQKVNAEQAATYSALMSASQTFIADDVLDAYDVSKHQKLLDVGGGEGVFLKAAAARAPSLELALFDLPEVARRAQDSINASGLQARARALGGDFFADELPQGADLISLVRVVYDHQDDNALQLMRAAKEALAPGGKLLLAEPMAATDGAEPVGASYFGFYLWAMGGGRSRSADELISMLHQAGFSSCRRLRTKRPLLASVILAS